MPAKCEFSRLPKSVTPINYNLWLKPSLEQFAFDGKVDVEVAVNESVKEIVLNSVDIKISSATYCQKDLKILDSSEVVFDEPQEKVTISCDKHICVGKFGPSCLQMDLYKESVKNRKNKESSQEPLLNLSASQLVELMTCAMKRKSSLPPSPQDDNPKKQCLSSMTDFVSQTEPNHHIATGLNESKQTLVERNKYLEKRVKELEALNYKLQFGIVESVQNAVTEILKSQFNMNGLILRKQSSERMPQHSGQSNNYVGCSSQQQPQIWQQDSDQEETMISSVTSTTMKSSDLSVEGFSDTVDRSNKEPIDVNSDKFVRSPSHGVVVQYIKPEDDSNVDTALRIYENTNYSLSDFSPTNSSYTIAPFGSEKRPENACTNQIITSNDTRQDRLLGMAHEIQTIVRESTNYKKLTNRLLNALFDREELASSTLTGKFKGEHEKEKLDEDTVNLIVQQAVARFPGTSPTDIRIVISQNCKDKALRLQRRQAKIAALYGE